MPPYNPDSYIDVQDRITRFWAEYPDGAIRTRLDSDPGDFTQCRYRAEIYKQRDNAAPDATGYAFELAGGGGANRTSHEENCETSAIGRALANMGYATSLKDRPSKQEMQKVARQAGEVEDRAVSQRPAPPRNAPVRATNAPGREIATPRQREMIRERWGALRLNPAQLDATAQRLYGAAVDQLSPTQAGEFIDRLDQKITAASPTGVTPQPADDAPDDAGMSDDELHALRLEIDAEAAPVSGGADRWTY